MKISVLTPSYNSGEFIERAIKSVIAQDYENWEHIIIDGKSTDRTIEVLKKYSHIKWKSEKDRGQSDAMNKAFKCATGDLIVYLNADDEIASGAFSFVVDYFKKNKSCQFLLGNLFLKGGGFDKIQQPSDNLESILKIEKWSFPFNPVSYYYKRDVQEKIGPFPINNHYTMDYWFLLRAYKNFKICKCNIVLGTFHYHSNNKSLEENSTISRRSLEKTRFQFALSHPAWFLKHMLAKRDRIYPMKKKQEMKKILFISTNDHVPWGGSEVLWSETALRLLKKENTDIAFSVQKWNPTPPHIESLISAGAKGYLRQPPPPASIAKMAFKKLFKHRGRSDSWKFDCIQGFQPDLVVLSLGNHNSSSEWMEQFIAQNLPYALIIQLVRDGYVPGDKDPAYKKLKAGYLGAKSVFCVSEDNLNILRKQFANPLTNASIIFNPYKHPGQQLKYPASNGMIQVAVTASLNINHKGHDILFDLLRSEKWRNRNIHFNLYGNGPHEEILKNLAAFFGIESQITFQGFEPDVSKIWSHNHALLLPSRMEGMSLALLEALMHERTAITTDLGDSKKLMEDNTHGFIIKAPTTELLDEALERAWQAREQWEEMGKKAKERLINIIPPDPVEHFSLEIEKILETL